MDIYKKHHADGTFMCSACEDKGLPNHTESAVITTPRNYETEKLWAVIRSMTGCVGEVGLSHKRRRCTDEFHAKKVAKQQAINKADEETEVAEAVERAAQKTAVAAARRILDSDSE